jgi:hypothetical protein
MMTLTRNVKKEAEKAGFVAVGISNLDMLHKLPYGKIKHVGTLKTPEEALPEVKSVILMSIHAWDPVFNIVARALRQNVAWTFQRTRMLNSFSKIK